MHCTAEHINLNMSNKSTTSEINFSAKLDSKESFVGFIFGLAFPCLNFSGQQNQKQIYVRVSLIRESQINKWIPYLK